MSAQRVRITTAGKVHNYVEYVLSVLDPAREHEALARACGCGIVQLEAEGHAVNKAVTVALREYLARDAVGQFGLYPVLVGAEDALALVCGERDGDVGEMSKVMERFVYRRTSVLASRIWRARAAIWIEWRASPRLVCG